MPMLTGDSTCCLRDNFLGFIYVRVDLATSLKGKEEGGKTIRGDKG